MLATVTNQPTRYVAYYRVSTQRQGRSGLGLEAQKSTVANFLKGVEGNVLDSEFTEVESGKKVNRIQLHKALARCQATGATLIIAKLDRLARKASFLFELMEGKTKFLACDCPGMNELTVGVLAVVAQAEAKFISERTKAALAAAKARGVKLGGDRGVPMKQEVTKAGHAANRKKADDFVTGISGYIRRAQHEGRMSLREIADFLNDENVATARGGRWCASTVRNMLSRMERLGL